jgi:shikimate dehydrogenase
MQNAALRAAGISLDYEAWDVEPEALAGTLRRLKAERGAGNVTVPHKQAALALCDRLSPMAHRVGAVNTFWMHAGSLTGDNTDVGGFDRAVIQMRGSAPSHATIGVLGAGGAAAAVLAAVAGWIDCRALLWNRNAGRARSLAARFPNIAAVAGGAVDAVAGAAIVVNATPVGLAGDELPIDPELLPQGADVIDLVYRPGETAWVRAVRARGHRASDGLSMLLEQGALAFERWFGIAPDREAMAQAMVQATHARSN